MTLSQPLLSRAFLDHLRQQRINVTIFLTNGVKLQGAISYVDEKSITLTRDTHTQLVMVHAMATVMPEAPLQVSDIAGFDHAGNV